MDASEQERRWFQEVLMEELQSYTWKGTEADLKQPDTIVVMENPETRP